MNQSIRLHVNENHFSKPYLKQIDITNQIEYLIDYPDSSCATLATYVAEYNNIDDSCIYFGNGLDEVIATLILLFSHEGETIIFPENTFSAYQESVRIFHRIPVISRLKDYRIDVENILDCIKKGAKIVFLCNPHNPTGSSLSYEELFSILQACEEIGAYLVVDEAYYDYCGITLGLSQAALNPNLFILRTFSKFYSMAGLRLGYAVSTKENIYKLHKIKSVLPFNVNHIAQVYGEMIFQQINYNRDNILNEFLKAKNYFCCSMDSIGITYLPSSANFITVKLGNSAENITETLKSAGILIRLCKDWNMFDFVRITVGTEDEINILLKALRQYFRRQCYISK